jgi:hypothetical protein
MRLLRLTACTWAIATCDVFIFGFGRTFLRGWEMPLLSLLKRPIICVYNGSDTRPPWMSGLFAIGPGAPDPDAMLAELHRQQRMLRWCERWSTALVCHPLSAQLLRRPFFNFMQLGNPCAPAPVPPSIPQGGRTALRIVHAPTQPLRKGSPRFRAIIEQLRREGRSIEYAELTGRPNHEVMAAIADADLVLDETYSDIPLAGLGSEAAWAGRAAVVGGYGRGEVEKFAAGTSLPMELFVHPDDLETTVRRLVDDPAYRIERARMAQAFLHTHWSPSAVAKRYLAIVDGTAPARWSVDPRTLTYWQGWGAPETAIIAAIQALVRKHGPAALGISHNPELERRLTALATSTIKTSDAAPSDR